MPLRFSSRSSAMYERQLGEERTRECDLLYRENALCLCGVYFLELCLKVAAQAV